MDLLKHFAPYQAIRTVYEELLQILFWGYSLKDLWKNEEERIRYYLSCLEEFDHGLAENDATGFSRKLEELMIREFHFTIQIMVSQEIPETEKLLVFGI